MKRIGLVFVILIFTIFSLSSLCQETQQPAPQPSPKKEIKTDSPKVVQPIKRIEMKKAGAEDAKPATPEEESGPPPKLEVPEMEFNAGDVIKGDVIEHEFILNNKGQGVLKVLRVQPTCGCTVTKYDNEIAPGKSGKILASVKTENFSGNIAKTINVQTNDKELATFALTVKGNVKTLLSVKPSERLSLGLVYVGTPIEKEFDITSEDGQPFEVTQITATDDKISYNLVLAPDKKTAKFKTTIPADYPVGPIQGNFTLKTTHPKVQTLNINLFGTMREPLSVFPQTVNYSGLSKDFVVSNPESPELNKVITVRFETEATLEIKSVKSNLPFIEATFEETQPKQAYSIKLHLVPDKVKVGPFEGAIVVLTNKKSVTVPVKGVIF